MRKTDAAPDRDDLLREARQLAPALYALARVLRWGGITEAGLPPLPPSELDVLRYVLDSPGTGTKTLAHDLGLHSSNVSTAVRGLLGRGLIRREPDPHDRRAVRLYPTMSAQHGMALIEDAWAEMFADALARLPPGERSALTAAVPALHALGAPLRGRRAPARD
ncbi:MULTISPECIES: MarR family winged helix-turn-helix transcriptional regulator [unclassified Nonomuraea]|uniref:MarR family winged helix-turn-helix transcriptional regulator n=1 Tax=unclassified Nonomuraea TaxID=2593643 RepID=UPI0033EFCB19